MRVKKRSGRCFSTGRTIARFGKRVASQIHSMTRVDYGLFVVIIVAGFLLAMTSFVTSRRFLFHVARRTRRNGAVGPGCRPGSARRANIKFDPKLGPAPTINDGDASGVDTARVDQIVLSAIAPSHSLAFTSTVGENHAVGSQPGSATRKQRRRDGLSHR